MNGFRATGTRQVDAWAARRLPPVQHLAGDLWSVPVPIQANPLRYTLSYLVPAGGGWVVVDPGWDTDAGWAALTAGLAAAGAGVGDVRGVVVTHVHPDHHGLSGRLQQDGAWVAMHPAERDTLPQRSSTEGAGTQRAAAQRWLLRSGAPDDEATALLFPFPVDGPAPGPALVEPDVLLKDGDPVGEQRLRAVWTPGHPGPSVPAGPDRAGPADRRSRAAEVQPRTSGCIPAPTSRRWPTSSRRWTR